MSLQGKIFVRQHQYRDRGNTFYRVIKQHPAGLLVQMIGKRVVSGDMWAGQEEPVDQLREDQKPIIATPRKNRDGEIIYWVRPFRQWRTMEPIYPHKEGETYPFTNYE